MFTPKDSLSLSRSGLDVPVGQVSAQIGALMRRDLGLGLLFVTGMVGHVNYGDGDRVESFLLREGDCELRADLAPSLRNPPAVQAGQTVRVTAWLAFYYPESRFRLIVKDLEILESAFVAASPAEQPVVAVPWVAPVIQVPLTRPARPERAAETLPVDSAEVPEFAHAVLPPWLEEIRRRQFGGLEAAPAAEAVPGFDADATLRAPRVRMADETIPAPDSELQSWLKELFDASETEDIELTRQASEVVAVRSGGGQEHFRALGAATVARMAERPATLPPPPPAAQDLFNQPTIRHAPVSRAAAQATPATVSPLQSPQPEPRIIEPAPRLPLELPPNWLIAGGFMLIAIVLAIVALIVWLT